MCRNRHQLRNKRLQLSKQKRSNLVLKRKRKVRIRRRSKVEGRSQREVEHKLRLASTFPNKMKWGVVLARIGETLILLQESP